MKPVTNPQPKETKDDVAYMLYLGYCRRIDSVPLAREAWEKFGNSIPATTGLIVTKASNRTGG